MTLPDSLLRVERASLLGPDAGTLREPLSGLCLSDDDEVAGRALLRRAELGLNEGNIAATHPSRVEMASRYGEAIDDVTAAGPKLQEGSDHELQARLLAARLLIRTLRVSNAAEMLHATRDSVRGKHRRTRLSLALAQGELALDTGDYAEADSMLRRAVGLARGDAVAHDHYQAAMSVAACQQLSGAPGGAVSWLRLARSTAQRYGDALRVADASFSLGNLLLAHDDVVGSRAALTEAVEAGLDPTSLPMALMALSRIELGTANFVAGVQRAVEAAQAGAAAANAAAFADGTIIAAQCQMGLKRTDLAIETLDAGAKVLHQRGEDQFARLVEMQKQEIMVGEGLVSPPEPDDPVT